MQHFIKLFLVGGDPVGKVFHAELQYNRIWLFTGFDWKNL